MDLRPLTLAELLDRAFSLYRRHLWVFAGIMALPAAFGVIWIALIQLQRVALPAGSTATPQQALRILVPFFGAALVFFILYFVAYAVALGATAVAVSQIYLGRDTTVRAAYAAVRARIGRLVLVMLWATLRVFGVGFAILVLSGILSAVVAAALPRPAGGLVAFFIFAVAILGSLVLMTLMGVRYGVSIPAAALEDQPASAALGRSVDLTSSNRWRVFLVILCAVIVTYATSLLLQGPFMVANFVVGPATLEGRLLMAIGGVVGAIGSMFTAPVMVIGLVLIYYDLRIRKEAFDLQVLLEAVDR